MSKDSEKPSHFSGFLSRPLLDKLKTPAILLLAGAALIVAAGPSIDGTVMRVDAAFLGITFCISAALIAKSNFTPLSPS